MNSLKDVDNSITEIIEFGDEGFTVKSSNPHGFYSIHTSKGILPDELSGKYTSVKMAADHARSVLTKNKK